jgi:hypothetical protein
VTIDITCGAAIAASASIAAGRFGAVLHVGGRRIVGNRSAAG